MTIPDSIPFSSIDLGGRGRTVYDGIENLAESIEQVGLIQPIVLEAYHAPTELLDRSTRYLLRAGGRRYTALASLGTTTLYHAATASPRRPGFLLANDSADQLTGLLIELAENHDRSDIDWRDDLRLTMKAFDLFKKNELASPTADFSVSGLAALQTQFGRMSKMVAADLKHGQIVIRYLDQHPEWFASCATIRAAYQVICSKNAEHITKLAAEKSYGAGRIPLKVEGEPPVSGQPDQPQDAAPPLVIPLSKSVFLGSGLDYMRSLPDASVDHIITDPDYAVSLDLLESNSERMSSGVFHENVDASLDELNAFIHEAFRVTKGFCILWYDLDHHEKLQAMARVAGWRVQRWPLTWIKLDAGSNGAPSHNTAKNTEWAMILRHPAATLTQVHQRSTYSCTSRETTRAFGHPFAKPIELWRWLFSMCTIKGQTVLDPFGGKGSCPCAAIQHGLKPLACEIQDAHFGDLQLNMQAYYREILGTNIAFS